MSGSCRVLEAMSSKQRPVVVRLRYRSFAGCLPSAQIALNRQHPHHLTLDNPHRTHYEATTPPARERESDAADSSPSALARISWAWPKLESLAGISVTA